MTEESPLAGSKTVYYLPGHGGRLSTGLGQGLLNRGFNVTGRATVDAFRHLPFMEQVRIVTEDLQTHFWSPEDHVVANSFGAYLFLNAQAQLPPYPGHLLLLSPNLGDFEDSENQRVFSPPFPERLKKLVFAGKFPSPLNAKIHVGEQDWQSVPDTVVAFGQAARIPVTVVPNAGHMLGAEHVGGLIDRWL